MPYPVLDIVTGKKVCALGESLPGVWAQLPRKPRPKQGLGAEEDWSYTREEGGGQQDRARGANRAALCRRAPRPDPAGGRVRGFRSRSMSNETGVSLSRGEGSSTAPHCVPHLGTVLPPAVAQSLQAESRSCCSQRAGQLSLQQPALRAAGGTSALKGIQLELTLW